MTTREDKPKKWQASAAETQRSRRLFFCLGRAMPARGYVVIAALMFLPMLCSYALADAPPPVAKDSQESRVPYVTPEVVKAWREQGRSISLLDVRAADEFEAGHIAESITIHYDQVASITKQLSHDEPIVVYCIHSAHRAPQAAKTLRQLGFQNTYVMEGGIVAWQVAGFPIQANDLAKTPTILPKTERCDALGQHVSDANQAVAHESGSGQ